MSEKIALILARGGSKGIPLKNRRQVGPLSLLDLGLITCFRAQCFDRVIVSTDHHLIANDARMLGAEVFSRSPESASDEATSEESVIEVLDTLAIRDESIVALIQLTSPFTDPDSLRRGVSLLSDSHVDEAVLGVVQSHPFVWEWDGTSLAQKNHGKSVRAPRQKGPISFTETGSFYIFRAGVIRATGSRFGKRAVPLEQKISEHFEIDTLEQLSHANLLYSAYSRKKKTSYPKQSISALALDFDGIFTDNTALIDGNGREYARVNRSDGAALARLAQYPIEIIVLTDDQSGLAAERCRQLGIEMNNEPGPKRERLLSWLESKSLSASSIAYAGNDRNDIGCLASVGWATCPPDSSTQVLEICDYIGTRRGGQGYIAELVDILMSRVQK